MMLVGIWQMFLYRVILQRLLMMRMMTRTMRIHSVVN